MGKRDLPDIYAQARGLQARRQGHICKGYNMVRRDLPDIYAQCLRARSTQGRVRIYQANPN